MIKKIILWLLTLFSSIAAQAQCGESLVDSAIADCGSNAICMREFKVRFNEGTISNPTPMRKYSVMLSEGVVYRFAIRNASEFEGEAIMQLYDKNTLLGSTYDIDVHIDNKQFDFLCDRTGRYQVLMSFKEGKAGCAAGVMSMVMEDTTSKLDPTVLVVNEDNVLYLHMKNKLQIASIDVEDGQFEIQISHGVIQKTAKELYIEVYEKRDAEVYVTLKNKSDSILQIDTFAFQVKDLPLPYAAINGKIGGFFEKHNVWRIKSLELFYVYEYNTSEPPFTVLSFMITGKQNDMNGLMSNEEYFSLNQLDFLSSLEVGESFFIQNIRVRGPNNKVYTLQPVGFIMN